MLKKSLFSNKKLFTLHSWLGITLGLLLFVIFFSGSIAVLSHEIDWLLNPGIRVTPQDKKVSWDKIYENTRKLFPDSYIRGFDAPSGLKHASRVWVETPQDQIRFVYVNPYTGEVQGDTSFFNVARFFRDFHRRFFLSWGIYFVGFFGFVMTGSIVTGLVFYKKWWQRALLLRLRKGLRTLFSDIHKLIGIWSLWFAIIIAVTGMWYFVEALLYDIGKGINTPPVKISEQALLEHGPTPVPLGLNDYIKQAKNEFPDLRIKGFRIPSRPDEPVYVDGQKSAHLVRSRSNHVYLDPYSGSVVSSQKAEDLSPLRRWVDTADPIHFGDFGGIISKIIWFVFGIGLSFMTLSGAFIWYIRNNRSPSAGKKTLVTSMIFTTFIMALASYNCYAGMVRYGPKPVPQNQLLGQKEVGPWKVALFREDKTNSERATEYKVEFIQSVGKPNYKKLILRRSNDNNSKTESFEINGDWHDLKASIPASNSESGNSIWLTVEGWEGKEYTTSFDILNNSGTEIEDTTINAISDENTNHLPEVHPGVIIFIAGFVVLTLGIIGFWFRMVLKKLHLDT